MAGITSYGAYIPMCRLPLAAIGGGKTEIPEGGPERSVAYFDEDSVTMAVAAARDCLSGINRGLVDGVLFASTTYPYKEKQGASVIAKALDLRRDVRSADFAGSLRAGTNALRSALDAVRSGSARNVLVVASDCRLAAPRSALERNLGDGAAAFLVGDSDVAVSVEAEHAISDELIDVWRTNDDRFVRTWEDRFIVQHGYRENLIEAIQGLLEKTGQAPQDFTKAVLYGPDARSHTGVARALGLDPSAALQSPLFGQLGNTGAAFALMLLVAALEEAHAGERLLFASYGDGAEALALQVTDKIEKISGKRAIRWHLDRRRELRSYDAYLALRDLQPGELDRRGGGGVSATIHFRDRDQDISFHGQQCRRCKTMQFPFQRVCYRCFTRDDLEPVGLAERRGKLCAYTFDFFAGSPDPPQIVTMTEAEGGCRIHLQMTDASPKEVKLDLPVEFVFRKVHEFGGTPNYFWKCTPVR